MSGQCAACGHPNIDGDVCDSRCEQIASERLKWQGKDPCAVCMEHDDECDWEPATVGDLCSSHAEQANEAAYERQCEDFYGAGAPVTVQEQYDAARRPL